MNEELAYRDLDSDAEKVLNKRGFSMYDTEDNSVGRCEDCGRRGHCEC